jgi:hypothetical protein
MRLLAHPVTQAEATAVIALLTASLAQAVALVMVRLAAPVAAVGGLEMAVQEHQAKALLEVLVLTAKISVALWAVAEVVLAEHPRHQQTEVHKLEVLVLHQQLRDSLCISLAAVEAVELLETPLPLVVLVAEAMAPQQLERLVAQAQAEEAALMPMVAQVLLFFHLQLKLLQPLAVRESHEQALTTFTHLPHRALLHFKETSWHILQKLLTASSQKYLLSSKTLSTRVCSATQHFGCKHHTTLMAVSIQKDVPCVKTTQVLGIHTMQSAMRLSPHNHSNHGI